MVMTMNNWTALLFMLLYVAPFAAVVYSRRRRVYAKRIRTWRDRMASLADRPFDLRLLTAPERERLVGRDGLNSEQWARAWAADFIAGRRDKAPTCGDYLREFGAHPKVRTPQP